MMIHTLSGICKKQKEKVENTFTGFSLSRLINKSLFYFVIHGKKEDISVDNKNVLPTKNATIVLVTKKLLYTIQTYITYYEPYND